MFSPFRKGLLAALLAETFLIASLPVSASDIKEINFPSVDGSLIAIEGPIDLRQLDSGRQNQNASAEKVSGWESDGVAPETSAPQQAPLPGDSEVSPNGDIVNSENQANSLSLSAVAADSNHAEMKESHGAIAGEKPEDKTAIREIASAATTPQEIAIVDNDENRDEAVREEYKVQTTTDEHGKTKITAGARFPVSILSTHNSKTAKVGDIVEARLQKDLKVGDKLIAARGSRVQGRVTMCAPARRILAAELSAKRWMRANGAIGVQFEEIISHNGAHLPLVAAPARSARVVKNVNEGRVLGVNHNGEVAAPLSTQLKHQAGHLAIRGAASVGGVFSFGIVPVGYAVVGAINPSFAFLHPVGKNVRHRRLKGFAMGLVAGLPGGFLIADTIIKGQEAIIKPGDVFLAEFKQDFTGEPATDAELMSGATTKVRGQVVSGAKKK